MFLPSQKFDTIYVSVPPAFINTVPFNPSTIVGSNITSTTTTTTSDNNDFINVRKLLLDVDFFLQHPIMTPTFDQFIVAQDFLSSQFT